MTEPAGPLGTLPQKPCLPGKGANLDRIIQLNLGEVRTHARTWENFNNQGTKNDHPFRQTMINS